MNNKNKYSINKIRSKVINKINNKSNWANYDKSCRISVNESGNDKFILSEYVSEPPPSHPPDASVGLEVPRPSRDFPHTWDDYKCWYKYCTLVAP